MTFLDLQVGDVFEAYGATFQKLPSIVTKELPEANAVNTITWRPALFGPTVPVVFKRRGGMQGLVQQFHMCFRGHGLTAERQRT